MGNRCEVKAQTVILANGDFPKKGGVAWKLLAAATRVVCCDGAADAYRRRFGCWPAVVVGDMDSLAPHPSSLIPHPSSLFPIPDQETNDLEKAMAFCSKEGWRNVVVVGATGKREDHTIGNVFRALERQVPIVTDFGVFHPVCGRKVLKTAKGKGVSVFAPDPRTRMSSTGLAWPLEGVKFRNLFCATLNRATASRVTISSDKPAYVYVES